MNENAKTIRVAVAQPYTRLGDVEGNLAQVLELSSRAAHNDCRLVLLPEVALHGYSIPPHVLESAIEADGKVTETLRSHAVDKNIAIAVGAFEREPSDGGIYISHFIALPDGELIVQRKTGGHEKPGIARSEFNQKIFEVDGVRFSVAICIDSKNPLMLDALVDGGCQVELVPTAGGGAYSRFHYEDLEDEERFKVYEEAMAGSCFAGGGVMRERYLLRMALATANLATGDDGHDYFQQGHSIIIDSDGNFLAVIPGTYIQEHFTPRITWADIHPQTPRRLPPPPPTSS